MPKSMPSPTNSTKNATEIKLNAPTRNKPQATEIARPTVMLTTTAKMMRNERSASHRITSTARIETAAGETRGPARQDVLHGIGRHRHRPRHVVELQLLALDAGEPERQRVESAPQARIDGERLEQGIRAREPVGDALNLLGRQEQQ